MKQAEKTDIAVDLAGPLAAEYGNTKMAVDLPVEEFSFPPGWRGRLLETVFGRRFVTGPADSLGRLKRAAEQRPIPSSK